MGWCVSVCLKTNIHWNTMNTIAALYLRINALLTEKMLTLVLAAAAPRELPLLRAEAPAVLRIRQPLPQPVARAVVRKQPWSRRLMAGRGHF